MAKERTSPNRDGNGQLGRCSCTALRKATGRVSQLYDAALASSGLKTTQRAILAQIDRAKNSILSEFFEPPLAMMRESRADRDHSEAISAPVRPSASRWRDRSRMFRYDADATPIPSPNPRLRIEADDARADNRRRVIDIAREAVIIHRSVAGVTMMIRAPSTAYRGVALRLAKLSGDGVRCEVRLEHRDPDLSVLLAEGEDQAVIEGRWRDWVGFFRLPALVERIDPATQAASLEVAGIARRRPCARRGGKASTARRPRFLVRRKVGLPSFAATVDANPARGSPRIEF